MIKSITDAAYSDIKGLIEMSSVYDIGGLVELFLVTIIVSSEHVVFSWKVQLINTRLQTLNLNTSPEKVIA